VTPDALVSVEGVAKKYCRGLRSSLAYGLQDMGRELLGVTRKGDKLRAGEFWALSGINFEVKRGESVGLVGANGAGKTTLLKVLSGLLKPDAGQVRVRGRMAPLIALGAGFKPVLSGRENIYVNLSILGMSLKEIEERFKDIVEFSELGDAIDAPLQTYSSGMAARLGFSCAIHTEPDTLLVDEVLAVGDIRFRAKCYRRLADLRRRGMSFLLVSHSPTAVLGACAKCIYMEKGRIVEFGDTAQVIRRYEDDLRKIQSPAAGKAGRDAVKKAVAVDGFKIEDIFFADAQGQRIEAPLCGEPATFHIRCQCAAAFPPLKTTLIFREGFGEMQTVLTLTTGDGSLPMPAGRSDITLKFPFLGLQSGLYTLKIGITSGALEHVAASEAFRFYVGRSDKAQQSLFYQPCEWSVGAAPGDRPTPSENEKGKVNYVNQRPG
jgi:lipopolysaccharide transport system ATP-binding protein